MKSSRSLGYYEREDSYPTVLEVQILCRVPDVTFSLVFSKIQIKTDGVSCVNKDIFFLLCALRMAGEELSRVHDR